MNDRELVKVIGALDGIYSRLGGWMTVRELDTITIAKELLKEQKQTIEKLNKFINEFSKDAVVPVRCKDCKYFDGQDCKNRIESISNDPEW